MLSLMHEPAGEEKGGTKETMSRAVLLSLHEPASDEEEEEGQSACVSVWVSLLGVRTICLCPHLRADVVRQLWCLS
jgi:hypothetical protein